MTPGLLLALLGLFSQTPQEGFGEPLTSPYAEEYAKLAALDPLERLRGAWLIPHVSIKGDTLAFGGGRAADFRILADGVPLWEPQTGGMMVRLPRSLLADARLGFSELSLSQALLLSSRGADQGWHARGEATSPFFLDSLNRNGQGLLYARIPLGKKLALSVDGEAVMWDKRPQASLQLPRQGIAAYTGAASGILTPSERILVRARLLRSQTQQDRFSPRWTFNPESSPSYLELVDLVLFNFTYATEELYLEMGLSGFNSFFGKSGRKPGSLSLFETFTQQDSTGTPARLDTRNPLGVEGVFFSQGFNPQLQSRSSTADRARIKVGVFAADDHQIQGELNYATFDLITGITTYQGSTRRETSFQQNPNLAQIYVGDRIYLENLWIEPGMGLLYVSNEQGDTVTAQETSVSLSFEPKFALRAFLRDFLIEAETELAGAVPGYAAFFDFADNAPIADSLVLVSALDVRPEQGVRTRIQVQREWGKGLSLGASLYSLVGFRLLSAKLKETESDPRYVGIEPPGEMFGLSASPWIGWQTDWVGTLASYRLAWLKGSTAGVERDYRAILSGDTADDGMERLPLDSRHKLCLSANLRTPSRLGLLTGGWFMEPRLSLASGFPEEEDVWWGWCEVRAGKKVSIKGMEIELKAELLNPFGWDGPVIGELPPPSYPGEEDFPHRVQIGDPDYHPSRDANHDGYITAAEEVKAYSKAQDFYRAMSTSPIPARCFQLKLSIRF